MGSVGSDRCWRTLCRFPNISVHCGRAGNLWSLGHAPVVGPAYSLPARYLNQPEHMNTALDSLAIYLVRVAPALGLGAMMLFLARREPRLRIVLYLALFILLRDAMTPLGLWSFGTQGFFWMRLDSNWRFLVVFGVACLGLSLGVYYLDRENQSLFQWTRGRVSLGALWGIAGAMVVVAPLVVAYQYTAIELRGGRVPIQNIPAILICALLGNLF